MNQTQVESRSRRVLLAAMLLGAIAPVRAETASWLIGRWELKFDPDGSPKDFLEFGEGGQVVNISPQGRQAAGVYVIKEDGVKASFALPNGKTLPFLFIPTTDKRQLQVRSSRTGNVAVYEKAKR